MVRSSLSDVKLFFKRLNIPATNQHFFFPSLLFQILSKVGLSESRLPPTSAVSGPQEPTQVSRVDTHQEVAVKLGRFNLPEQQHITCLVLGISLSREVVYLLALRHRLNMMLLKMSPVFH